MNLNPELITQIVSTTVIAVGIILATAGFASALGWALIARQYLEGIARQPEVMPTLRVQMFITGGLMESFPFIVLAMAMWFVLANPFIGTAVTALAAISAGH